MAEGGMEDSRDIQSLREELEQIQKEIEHARKQKSTEEMLRREIDKARQELADLTSDKETSQPAEEWRGVESCVSSCKDIYINQRGTPTSGVYTIHSHTGPVSVFCDFYDDIGYTYISKHDLGKLSDLSGLYTEDDHAIVRVLYKDGEQHAVSIEQLSDYKHRYQLSFQLSDANGYKSPLNHDLKPYIYIGFLPREIASLKSKSKPAVQGYRTGGIDFKFNNSDQNPNSYLAFFANPKNLHDNPYYRRFSDNTFMTEWINRAQPIQKHRDMPEEFYYMYEMHMGGGGGYLSTSNTANIVKGAAVGLGFKLSK